MRTIEPCCRAEMMREAQVTSEVMTGFDGFWSDTETTRLPRRSWLSSSSLLVRSAPADHLFLASESDDSSCGDIGLGMGCGVSATGTTHLFDFQLDGIEARHIASGEVEAEDVELVDLP